MLDGQVEQNKFDDAGAPEAQCSQHCFGGWGWPLPSYPHTQELKFFFRGGGGCDALSRCALAPCPQSFLLPVGRASQAIGRTLASATSGLPPEPKRLERTLMVLARVWRSVLNIIHGPALRNALPHHVRNCCAIVEFLPLARAHSSRVRANAVSPPLLHMGSRLYRQTSAGIIAGARWAKRRPHCESTANEASAKPGCATEGQWAPKSTDPCRSVHRSVVKNGTRPPIRENNKNPCRKHVFSHRSVDRCVFCNGSVDGSVRIGTDRWGSQGVGACTKLAEHIGSSTTPLPQNAANHCVC